MLRVRVDRHRCVGAGNCIYIAPTAFDWKQGDYAKADVVDVTSVEEEKVREAALACPTQAIEVEEVEELLPWQMVMNRDRIGRRVIKTFMFTDIVGSTRLVELLGDEAWENLIRWHDETLRAVFAQYSGEEVAATGDGFFVGFDSPEDAVECAVTIQRKLAEHRRQHGFAPNIRIGLHASEAAQVGRDFKGKGVHEASRISSAAGKDEILASKVTVGTAPRYPVSEPREASLKGLEDPMEVVSIDWR